jgi:hypothetical protein
VVERSSNISRKKLITIICGVSLSLIPDVRSWAAGKVLDWLTGADAPAITRTLTREDRDQIATDIVGRLSRGVGAQQTQELMHGLTRDSAIAGVGSSSASEKVPLELTPRKSFGAFAAPPPLVLEPPPEIGTRTARTRERLTLISPVLNRSDRKWRFLLGSKEFSAHVRDRVFVQRVLSGEYGVRLQGGIQLDVELETSEALDNGVWVVRERTILTVSDIHGGGLDDLLDPTTED